LYKYERIILRKKKKPKHNHGTPKKHDKASYMNTGQSALYNRTYNQVSVVVSIPEPWLHEKLYTSPDYH